MSAEPTPRTARPRWPLLALILAALWLALAITAVDPDLWGHLRFGQDILARGGVVRTDPYSYLTAPGAWINHEWLAEVSFALAYGALGVRGLALLKALLGLAVLAAVYADQARDQGRPLGATLVVVLVTVAVLPALRQMRPQIYTVVLMTALLLVLRHYELGRRRLLLLAVPIMGLWVNLHGGVLAGAGVLGVWYGARLLQRGWRLRSLKHWRAMVAPYELLVVLAAWAATLANPYGAGLPAFLWRTATTQRPEIQDWQSAALSSYHGLSFMLLMAVLATVYMKARTRPSWSQAAVLLTLVVAAIGAQRHVTLLGLGVGILAGPALRSLLPAPLRGPGAGSTSALLAGGRRLGAMEVLVLAAAVVALGFGFRLAKTIAVSPADYPVQAVALLRESGVAANLVTPYNWGEYVIWHLGPQVQVSMDGRRETVYDEATYRAHLALYYGAAGWAGPVDLPASELVLAETGDPTDNLMRLKPGWALVYADATAALYAREGSALATTLAGRTVAEAEVEGLVFP